MVSSSALAGVQPADIILTTSNTSNTSNMIRLSTCSQYSHAILALPNGECIDATTESGVSPKPLSVALDSATKATLFRHKNINSDKASWVCIYAQQHQGKPYDYLGATRSGVSSGCFVTQFTRVGLTIVIVHEISGNHQASFFCSELIAYAFEDAGLPLLRIPARAATPKALAFSDRLTKVKELIS